jgi:hypothetical protein
LRRGRPCRDELTFGALADRRSGAESQAITPLFVSLPHAASRTLAHDSRT